MSAGDRASSRKPSSPGAGQRVGRYRLDVATGTWWWSAETFRVHGFQPGEVVPTTALVLAHDHPADREQVDRLLHAAAVTGAPFSSLHRIMDARGHERYVNLVGQGRRDPRTGVVVELVGYVVDVTDAVAARAHERAFRDIQAAAEGRGAIEQAKGVLIATYGVDEDEAFLRLRRASNDKNMRLRDLAHLVVDEAARARDDRTGQVDALLR